MPIKVGFIGAGGMASAHMNALQVVDDVQIAAIADIDQDRAESAAARFVAKAFSDHREMLEAEKLDAVYVCIPPFAHDGHEIAVADKGIHLFVEKPVAIDLDHARATSDVIRKKEIVSAVGYHWRYQSNTDRARELLKGKTIGMLMGYWMGGMPGMDWWRRMDQSGGQMVEQTTHIFDLARYLCGDVREVFAAYANRVSKDVPEFNVADVGVATLKFANGVVGTMANTCILNVPYTVGLHVVAKDLVVEIHGDLRVLELGHTEVFTGGVNAILEENRAFIEAVKKGNPALVRSDYHDAVKTLATTLACNESAMTGQPVRVVD